MSESIYITLNDGEETITATLTETTGETITVSMTEVTTGPQGPTGPSGSSVLTIGTTTISGGTTTRILYNNAGVAGEYSISGTGSVAMTTSPSFTTPTLGVATATSLASSGDISATGVGAEIYNTQGNFRTDAAGTYFRTRGTFKLYDGTYITTLSHAPSANRAIAFPDAAGTVVLDTATQTLTNKTLTSPTLTTPALGVATATSINSANIDGSPGVVRLTDASGSSFLSFAFSGTSTITVPGTGTRTIVTEEDTQTLTLKTLTSSTLTNPTVTNYVESVVAIGNSGTSQTIALTSGTVQTCTLTGNCTFTMPTATAGKSFILYLKTGAGSYTGTFTGVKWSGGTAPTITATASKMDILSFVADGTNWYGSIIQNFTP